MRDQAAALTLALVVLWGGPTFGDEVRCADLPANAPDPVRLAVCGDGKPKPTKAEQQARLHDERVTLLARRLATHLEIPVWCGRIMRPPAPAKACFSKPRPAPLCARQDELLAVVTTALKAKFSADVAAMIAPEAVASVGGMFGENPHGGPPRKDIVERAQRYTEHLVKQLAEMRAQKIVADQKLERWKADVKVKELAKAKTRQLAEEEARDIYGKESSYAKGYAERTQRECARQVASLAHLDRMDAEARRLLTGGKAAHWRALTTNVSAASRDGARDYHDNYALAEALVADNKVWLEAELKRLGQPSGPSESPPSVDDTNSDTTSADPQEGP